MWTSHHLMRFVFAVDLIAVFSGSCSGGARGSGDGCCSCWCYRRGVALALALFVVLVRCSWSLSWSRSHSHSQSHFVLVLGLVFAIVVVCCRCNCPHNVCVILVPCPGTFLSFSCYFQPVVVPGRGYLYRRMTLQSAWINNAPFSLSRWCILFYQEKI